MWEVNDTDDDLYMFGANCPQDIVSDTVHFHPLLSWLMHFLALLQRKCSLTKTTLAMLLHIFFTVLSRIAPQLVGFAKQFPRTVYQMELFFGSRKETFVRYVVCSKCYSVYKYNDCFCNMNGAMVPQLCKHRSSNFGPVCNGPLLKCVELLDNKILFYPLKVYCYLPLHYYLSTLLNRPGFCEQCDHWKKEGRSSAVFKDIYDGKIWQDFLSYNGKPFLSDAFTYGVMLNILTGLDLVSIQSIALEQFI